MRNKQGKATNSDPEREVPLQKETILKCFICGESHDKVEKLLSVPKNLFICDGCIVSCNAKVTESQTISQKISFILRSLNEDDESRLRSLLESLYDKKGNNDE